MLTMQQSSAHGGAAGVYSGHEADAEGVANPHTLNRAFTH